MSTEKAIAVISSEPVAAQFGQMSVQDVIDRKDKIAEVMTKVMRDGVHYGLIPGCGDKPTLYKSGAEILTMTFCLAPTYKIERIDLPGGHREYQVVCTLTHIASGCSLAEGVGAATTMESKHRWRGGGRRCPECGQAAIIKSKYGDRGWVCLSKKGGCGTEWKDGDPAIEDQPTGRVENPDPADQFNTALKMAKKRALVDCTLTATGASDVLAQDLEDLAPEDEGFDAPPSGRGQRSTAPQHARHTTRSERTAERGSAPALSEDAIVEIITAIGGCTTESDLKEVGSRIPYGRMDRATRERCTRAYGEQLAEIKHASKGAKAT